MKVLFSGVNGYIGTHLLPLLIEKGHEIFCFVRNKKRFHEKISLAISYILLKEIF